MPPVYHCFPSVSDLLALVPQEQALPRQVLQMIPVLLLALEDDLSAFSLLDLVCSELFDYSLYGEDVRPLM